VSTKLVRDRIPEIMESKGQVPFYVEADKKEKVFYLAEKVLEEAQELREELLKSLNGGNGFWDEKNEEVRKNIINELADVHDVLKAVQQVWNIRENELAFSRFHKTQKWGGFRKMVLLYFDEDE